MKSLVSKSDGIYLNLYNLTEIPDATYAKNRLTFDFVKKDIKIKFFISLKNTE